MADALYSSERLTKPLIRTGDRGSGDFREIPWDEALDIAAEKLRFFNERYGASSVMRIGGSGSCRGALHNSALLTQRFCPFSEGIRKQLETFQVRQVIL